MFELLTAITALFLIMLAFWLMADSDDDNSGGGLMEPALIPISTRKKESRLY